MSEHSYTQEHIPKPKLVLQQDMHQEAPRKVLDALRLVLRRLKRAMTLLLRALALFALWTPVTISGGAVGLLVRVPLMPEKLSVHVCDLWWRALLKAIDLSGPTFIKVCTYRRRDR